MANYDLVTVEQVKEALELPSADVDLDQLLPDYITQASRVILDYTKREFAPASTVATRRFKVIGYKVDLAPYDLQSATQVALHPETDSPTILVAGANTGYTLQPVSPERGVYQSIQLSGYLIIISQTLMAFGYALMDVTGTWGFPTVPGPVQRACIETVGSWVTRTMPGASNTGYGIPASSSAGMTTFRNDWHIPWSAKKKLDPYKRASARWAAI